MVGVGSDKAEAGLWRMWSHMCGAQEKRVWENPEMDCSYCFPGHWAVRAVGG